MKHFNTIILIAASVAIMALMGCKKNHSNSSDTTSTEAAIQNDESMFLRDSLATARDYMNTLSTLVNEVSDGLNEIKQMEQIVSSTNLSEETPDKRNQLLGDILLIKNSIQERQNKLAQLEAKLTSTEASNAYNENDRKSMLQTIANLKQQLSQQQAMIDNLTAQLEAANATIKDLSGRVDSLNAVNSTIKAENSRVKDDNQKAQAEVTRLNNVNNECFYAIGSKSELKNHKIIDTGFLRKTKVMQNSNIMHSYFTKADKRTLGEIHLHSKKAKVLTNHDTHSYRLDKGQDGSLILRITDPTLFWQYTNYLVVQVD